MSSVVYLRNKSNGRVYAYLNESVWDSENKRCICKRKCLGHVDPETGAIVPNSRDSDKGQATVQSVGATLFLRNVSDTIGFTDVVKEALPDDWELFLSCVFYVVIENGPLSGLVYWSRDNSIPYKGNIDYNRIIQLLDDMDMNTRFRFFRGWRDRFRDDDFCTMFLSFESSYDRHFDTIRFNDLPLVNVFQKTDVCVTFDSDSMVPVSYLRIKDVPHGYTDVRKAVTEESWLDYGKAIKVLDSSYYSEDNFSDLLNLNERFVMQVSMESKMARDNVERVHDRMMDIQNTMTINGEDFFVMSFLQYYGGRKCFMHIFFSPKEAENEFSLFLELLSDCKKELQNKMYVPEHADYYLKYFIQGTRNGKLHIEENGEAVMSYNTVAGFIVLVSNTVKNPQKAMEMFLLKSRIKKNFDNLKNERDRKRLKLSDEIHYENRMFIQFCATILYREVNRRKMKYSIIRDMTFSDIMNEMKVFKRMTIPGFDTPFFTNINNTQSKILKAFDMDIKNLK